MVHADLSEYNLLWDKDHGKVWIIDVSQAVDSDNPMAGEFLRMDCKNVVGFFRRHMDSRTLLSARQLFEFVTMSGLSTAEELEGHLESLHSSPELGLDDDSIFMEDTLPKPIKELNDDEVEVRLLSSAETQDSIGRAARAKHDTDLTIQEQMQEDATSLGLDVSMLPHLPPRGSKTAFKRMKR